MSVLIGEVQGLSVGKRVFVNSSKMQSIENHCPGINLLHKITSFHGQCSLWLTFGPIICDFGQTVPTRSDPEQCSFGLNDSRAPELVIEKRNCPSEFDVRSCGKIFADIILTPFLAEQLRSPPEGTKGREELRQMFDGWGIWPKLMDDLIEGMLSEKPENRPSLAEVVQSLENEACHLSGTEVEAFLAYKDCLDESETPIDGEGDKEITDVLAKISNSVTFWQSVVR
jgi:serine/threonine protein kinase